MSTALTDTITWGYTAPSTINVHFLGGDGSGTLNFASFTDANGNTFKADGWTVYEQQQAELAFQQFAAVANVSFNFVSNIAQADFVMVTGSNADVGVPGYWNVGGGTVSVDGATREHAVGDLRQAGHADGARHRGAAGDLWRQSRDEPRQHGLRPARHQRQGHLLPGHLGRRRYGHDSL